MVTTTKAAPEAPQEAPVENTATPAPKKSNVLKTVLIVGGVVVFAAASVGGYGLYNAYSIKSYAKKAETMFAQTKKWDDADLEISDLSSAEDQINKVQEDSTKYLAELNGMHAPKKAATLESDLKEYFTKAEKVAKLAGDMFTYLNEVEKVTKIYTDSFSSAPAATSTEAMAAEMEQAKTQMQAALAEMDNIDVPDSMKESHVAFRKMIADTIPVYDQMIVAFRNNDMNALMNVSSSAFTQSASSLENLNPETTLEKDLKADSERLEKLETEIPSEISKLKEVNFSF